MSKPNIQKIVKQVLTDNRAARDSDALVLRDTYRKINSKISALTYDYFWGLIHDKTLPSVESVVRARRLIQEKDIDMRGDNYDLRHKHEEHIREIIKKEPEQAIFDMS